MKLSYYPGCSLHSTAKEYDESTRAVLRLLDVELHELEDWNCCGATSAHSVDDLLSVALPARNLAIAEENNHDLLIPCAACYSRSKMAHRRLTEDPGLRETVSELIGLPYEGRVGIKNILEVLTQEPVLGRVREKVKRPLNNLRAVCYYGCLIVRPPKVTEAADHESPESMDKLVELLGGTSLPWSYKTDCCGGSLVLVRTDIVERLIGTLFEMALEAGAECIVTACPLCQLNLDTRQKGVSLQYGREYDLPIFYISELMALAMGYPDVHKWWKRHLTDPRKLLRAKGLI